MTRNPHLSRSDHPAALAALLLLPAAAGGAQDHRTAVRADTASTVFVAEPFREELLGTLPLGEDASQLSPHAPEGWEPDRTGHLGFAIAGFDTSVYVYDFVKKNIKELHPGRTPGTPAVIPGIDLYPDDGAVTPGGTLYLFVDRWANGRPIEAPRFVVYCRPRNAPSWTESEPITTDFGELGGAPLYGSVFISSTADGEVYLGGLDGRCIAVGREAHLFNPGERFEAEINPARFGRARNVDPRRIVIRSGDGRVVKQVEPTMDLSSRGADRSGNSYCFMFHAPACETVSRYDRGGILAAVGLLRLRRSDRWLVGKGPVIVSPQGRLLEFHLGSSALEIFALSYGQ